MVFGIDACIDLLFVDDNPLFPFDNVFVAVSDREAEKRLVVGLKNKFVDPAPEVATHHPAADASTENLANTFFNEIKIFR